MDWDSIKICQEKDKEGLNRKEFIEDLSRSYPAWRNMLFKVYQLTLTSLRNMLATII